MNGGVTTGGSFTPPSTQQGQNQTGGMADAPLIPSWRLLSALLELFGTLVLYMNRVNISFAIVCMTKPPDTGVVMMGNNFNKTDAWLETNLSNSLSISSLSNSSSGEAQFDWSRKLVGFIISSNYIGHVITQIPSGWAATRVSAKWIMASGMGVAILASFLSPVAANGGWGYLVAMQIIKGLASGFVYPALHVLISSWAAPHERSRLFAVAYSGSPIGNIIGFLSAGYLCSGRFAGGWPAVFYAYGIVGCVWLVFFIIFVHDSPEVHPFVSKQEKEYIQKSLAHDLSFGKGKKAKKVPWKSILTSPPLYAILSAQTAFCWLWYTALSSLPIYINDVLKFNVKDNGAASSMPYVANLLVGLFASYIADLIIQKQLLRKVVVRKLAVSCATLLPAIFIVSVGFLKSHQHHIAVTLISLAVGCLAFALSGNQVNTIEIAPQYASVIRGIDNTVCTITGILAPIITGQLAPNGTQAEWRRVFFLAGGISLFGQVVYMIFGTADVQPWAMQNIKDIDDKLVPDQQHSHPLLTSEKSNIQQTSSI